MRRRIRPPRRVGALRGLAAAALLLAASATPRAEERAGPEDVHAHLAAREVVVEARVDPESGGHRGVRVRRGGTWAATGARHYAAGCGESVGCAHGT